MRVTREVLSLWLAYRTGRGLARRGGMAGEVAAAAAICQDAQEMGTAEWLTPHIAPLPPLDDQVLWSRCLTRESLESSTELELATLV